MPGSVVGDIGRTRQVGVVIDVRFFVVFFLWGWQILLNLLSNAIKFTSSGGFVRVCRRSFRMGGYRVTMVLIVRVCGGAGDCEYVPACTWWYRGEGWC